MKHLGLFEGIGGFSLAARWMGWETVAWCEINPFCQKVLKYHFPEAEGLGDIKTTDFKKYANRIDILTGGFPCQPYSTAGKRKGKEDERHLWPEMLRAIREVSPRWIVGENVRGLTNWNGGLVFDEVQADLEAEGYEALPFLLPACAVNAPHRRHRIWFIAYTSSKQCSVSVQQWGQKQAENINFNWNDENGIITNPGLFGQEIGEKQTTGIKQCDKWNVTNAAVTRLEGRTGSKLFGEYERFTRNSKRNKWQNFPTQPPVCGGNDGLSRKLDGITFPKWRNESIKAYGNAIVPQVAYEIFKAIEQYGNLLHWYP